MGRHWRYISSFHGPWLQLPPEVLASLAHSNYLAPRPRPIDAAVFFDVVKIRRHVDEATNLAVRATSGLTSAALHGGGGHHHHHNSLLGGAAALGIGFGGGGGGTLSRERKHRMRELATGKLAAAYRLDEVAASVATMQSASTLEDVAQLVLQRSPLDADARYVHFFHEKIPSRMMAQCTPLDALDDLVAARPTDASALRTRALTRLFKDDYQNSARDLTEALAAARYLQAQHRRDARTEARPPDDDDDDHPSSLETQLLFHRAGVYLTLACAHVPAALDGLQQQEEATAARDAQAAAGEEPVAETPAETAARLARAESRKQLRQNAKRALRDYTAFLSHFDYTPGIAADVAEALLRQYQANDTNDYQAKLDRLLDDSAPDALVPYKKPAAWPSLPPPPVFTLNQLFDAVPPPALPPYPPTSNARPSPIPSSESLTYHPLLSDALHSLLLVHALLQTPPKELLRHAHNAARLVRLLDGYPIFLAARSPARSDWIEVVRRGGNWLGLASSWEKLCRAPSPPEAPSAHTGTLTKTGPARPPPPTHETKAQRRDRHKHEAILDALADDRVVDEESFQRAVRARELRFKEDDEADAKREDAEREAAHSRLAITNGAAESPPLLPPQPKRWQKSDKDANEYGIGSDRADKIARWVCDAPPLVAASSSTTKGKKKRRKGPARKGGVEDGLAGLV